MNSYIYITIISRLVYEYHEATPWIPVFQAWWADEIFMFFLVGFGGGNKKLQTLKNQHITKQYPTILFRPNLDRLHAFATSRFMLEWFLSRAFIWSSKHFLLLISHSKPPKPKPDDWFGFRWSRFSLWDCGNPMLLG